MQEFMPQNGGFWGVYLANGEQPYGDPQSELPYVETRNAAYRSFRSVQPFMRSLAFLSNSQNRMLAMGQKLP